MSSASALLGRFLLFALLGASLAVACDDPSQIDVPEPVLLEAVAGAGQSGTVGEPLPALLTLRLTDEGGRGIPGQQLRISVAGGGRVDEIKPTTDENGELSLRWTLGTSTAAPQRMEVRWLDPRDQADGLRVMVTATALSGAPHELLALSPLQVAGLAGEAIADSVRVLVVDSYQNPVPGVTVRSSVTAGDGVVAPDSVLTDSAGVAAMAWILGATAGGEQALRVEVDGAGALDFTAQAATGPIAIVEIQPVGVELRALGRTSRLTASATDAHGNPIDVVMLWSSLTPGVAVVDDTGAVVAVANGIAGIVATAGFAADTAWVTVRQVAASITLDSPAYTLVEDSTAALVAIVRDSAGALIPSADLHWSTANPSIARVDSSGRLTALSPGRTTAVATMDGIEATSIVDVFADPTPGPPNIILIISDDQDAHSFQYMEALQRLVADAGTTFPNFFVTHPVCCPSRASFLTGLYSHNHRVLSNEGAFGGFPAYLLEDRSLPVWLQDAGYRTALMGKYMNGYFETAPSHVPPGWDRWIAAASYFGHSINVDGVLEPLGFDEDDYATDRLSEYAAQFIGDAVRERQPFFLYLAPKAPHDPATPAPRHVGRAAGIQMPRSPSFNEADVSDKPLGIANRPLFTDAEIADMESQYRSRVETLYALDELIGAMIDSLDALGVLDDTYILYTSDHGYHLGNHRLPPGKNTPYEEDIRLPLIVRGPAVAAGIERDDMVINQDVAATILELAGVNGITTDGTSFAGVLTGQGGGGRQRFLIEKWSPEGVQTWQAVRTRRYTYVAHAHGERQLYDLWADPYQLDNIAYSASSDLLADLSGWLTALAACSGTACRTAEFSD